MITRRFSGSQQVQTLLTGAVSPQAGNFVMIRSGIQSNNMLRVTFRHNGLPKGTVDLNATLASTTNPAFNFAIPPNLVNDTVDSIHIAPMLNSTWQTLTGNFEPIRLEAGTATLALGSNWNFWSWSPDGKFNSDFGFQVTFWWGVGATNAFIRLPGSLHQETNMFRDNGSIWQPITMNRDNGSVWQPSPLVRL